MPTNTEELLRMGNEASLSKESTKKEKADEKVIIDPKEFSTYYTLDYKALHHVDRVLFKGPEDMSIAINLGHGFCSKRNWRFIQVRPMFVDILSEPQSEEERAKWGANK